MVFLPCCKNEDKKKSHRKKKEKKKKGVHSLPPGPLPPSHFMPSHQETAGNKEGKEEKHIRGGEGGRGSAVETYIVLAAACSTLLLIKGGGERCTNGYSTT